MRYAHNINYLPWPVHVYTTQYMYTIACTATQTMCTNLLEVWCKFKLLVAYKSKQLVYMQRLRGISIYTCTDRVAWYHGS